MLVFAQSGYFHDLLDSFALGVVILNARGRVYAANTAAAALLGHSREELLSDPAVAADVFRRTDNPKALRRYLRTALRREHPGGPLRLQYRALDGTSLHLSLTFSHLVENEKVFGVMLQITDVTEIMTLHERERRILDEKYRVERERVESLRALSSAVAHQLRNPAMSIGGLTGLLLKKSPPDDPARPFLQAVLEESKRLEAIVAAVGEATLPLSPQTSCFSLRDLVQSRLAHVRAVTGERGLSAVWNLHGDDGRLCLDESLLGQALDEILLNAAEASPSGGRVDVALSAHRTADGHADHASITVRDQGPGIAADIIPFLFDPFFTTKAVGVGMGLCRARRIMAALDGEIRVDNHPDGGTVAILQVAGAPAPDDDADAEKSREAAV
ncbi:PAS domain S-box protein [Desulfovibrio sulfodismutans]|uniref:histidine kinase n=1 Tax=Desulfolutivibrio sulfodismutans TaxID=63561 RepID=A0A7K3NK79_9BACT|nr:ATP-binding protein [Desulfolutivibrio sulfodismutans]NDY55629.1 PAS domain S-box protein [Desulfolutivibrio sulfodismutans]